MVQNGAMVPEEDRQMKRQRRLIKNRESAQLSRLRKKMYIDDLEKKVNALTQDNETLTKKVRFRMTTKEMDQKNSCFHELGCYIGSRE